MSKTLLSYSGFTLLIAFIFSSFSVKAQGIVNTEKMLSDADDTFTFSIDVNGNFSFGNIRLFQASSSLTGGIKRDKHLLRAVLGYDYLRNEGVIKSSDVFHQFRYNYSIGKHSLYGFYQIQNTRSLKLKNRSLSGAGIRFNLLRKAGDYFDVALGGFYESEKYDSETLLFEPITVNNVKMNANAFWKLQLAERTQFISTIYYQVAADNLSDQRLFVESKISYLLNKADFSVMYRNRTHTEPYISGIDKSDQRVLFGFSFDL